MATGHGVFPIQGMILKLIFPSTFYSRFAQRCMLNRFMQENQAFIADKINRRAIIGDLREESR